ncbi:hypothetical protein EYF80_018032 [Liparis tanakae]|uniref:Uncharacterized protein n=1 Tax=Liparis tanakae TaxID=230148 RepID=A0A4Z2I1I5_9TELE|nr:hypothetical protein EYF80_018032 [Liparis tanakae]
MEQQGTRQTAECGAIMMRVARIQEGGDEKTDTVGGVYFFRRLQLRKWLRGAHAQGCAPIKHHRGGASGRALESSFHSNPPVSVKGQRRGGSCPLPKPTAPSPQPAPTLEPGARKLNQRGASEGSGPLKTPHCLQKASPHRGRSICNTIRQVKRALSHYNLLRCSAPPGRAAVCIDEQIDLALDQDRRLTAT